MDSFIPMPTQDYVDGILPKAKIRICVGIPWDNKYEHVRLFNNRQELFNYVDSKAIYKTDSAALVKRGSAELHVPVNECYADSANYIAFYNEGYANNWVYGFITSIEPLSINSCRINFELDVWTNCQFDMVLNQCFIEREIVAKSKDVIGAYTYPEGLETGQYINQDGAIQYQCPTYDEREYSIGIASTFNEDGSVSTGEIRDNLYTGVEYHVFNDASSASAYVQAIVEGGLSDGIVGAFMMPTAFIAEEAQWKRVQIEKKYDNIDGYVPKNNKLFCYPYNFLYANNNKGTGNEYRYEFFRDDTIEFEYTVIFDTEPVLCAYPIWYNNINQNYLEMITYNSYPKCPLAIDSFKAWLAQSGSQVVASQFNLDETETTLLSGVLNSFSNNSAASMSTVSGITGAIAQTTKAYMQAPQLKTQGSNNLNSVIGNQEITFFRAGIRAEYAKKIDDFFTMFGYKMC